MQVIGVDALLLGVTGGGRQPLELQTTRASTAPQPPPEESGERDSGKVSDELRKKQPEETAVVEDAEPVDIRQSTRDQGIRTGENKSNTIVIIRLYH